MTFFGCARKQCRFRKHFRNDAGWTPYVNRTVIRLAKQYFRCSVPKGYNLKLRKQLIIHHGNWNNCLTFLPPKLVSFQSHMSWPNQNRPILNGPQTISKCSVVSDLYERYGANEENRRQSVVHRLISENETRWNARRANKNLWILDIRKAFC